MTIRRLLPIAIVSLFLSACESLSYYSQAAEGQLSLWWHSRSIDALIADETTNIELKQRLLLVQKIQNFAVSELGLPDTGSYQSYSDIGRTHVVWNVYAAKEFSLKPHEWCFPIAGCVTYKGFFSKQSAYNYADRLNNNGLDTFVSGVAAYSTLGWFDDPVLNTFIYRERVQLAAMLFHELAHQQLYVPGDTTFNESFATVVEIEGVRRWLALNQSEDELAMARYQKSKAAHSDFVDTLMNARKRLDALYQKRIGPLEMRLKRQQYFQQILNEDYQEFKQRWGGLDRYDRWIGYPEKPALNNAKLSTISSYHQWRVAFQKVLAREKGDLDAFYKAALVLAKLPEQERHEQLLLLN